MSVHAHRTEGVTGSEGREGANGVGVGIGVRGGNGDGNGDVNGDGDRAGTGTATGVEANKGTKDGSGDGRGDGRERGWRPGDGNRMGTGAGTETRAVAEVVTGARMIMGTGTRIGSGRGGEGGGEAKKRKKPHKSCRHHVGNGGDLGGKKKKRTKERVGAVTANPDNLANNKEAGEGAQGTQSLSKNCTSRESVSPLSRLIRGFRNKYN